MTASPPRAAELDALIRLLDDPDPSVHAAVRARLRALGPAALPHLTGAAREASGALRGLLSELIHDIRFSTVAEGWQALIGASEVDLEEGAFLLARYRFPEIDLDPYHAELDRLAAGAQERLASAAGVQRAIVLSDFLFDQEGFRGNTRQYYDPNNSYLSWVLDHRTGIPVSLAVVYLLVGRRLGLPVYGVNMPAHFLVKYEASDGELFLDVFNGGTPLLKEDAAEFLLRSSIEPQPSFFERADSRTILLRMVRNLLAIAYETGQQEVIEDMAQLLAVSRRPGE